MKNLYTKLCIASLCIGPYAQAAVVDVFIATGQSNAYWPVGPAPTYEGSYDFGKGVQDALTASGLFSNPTVVLDGQPGIEIHNGMMGLIRNGCIMVSFSILLVVLLGV